MRLPLQPSAAPNPTNITKKSSRSLYTTHMNKPAGMAVKIAMK
jgi:hypothetical protein